MKISPAVLVAGFLLGPTAAAVAQVRPIAEIVYLRGAFEVYENGRWGLVQIVPEPVAYVDTRSEVIIAIKRANVIALAAQLRSLVPSEVTEELTQEDLLRWAMSQIQPDIYLYSPAEASDDRLRFDAERIRNLVPEMQHFGSEHYVFARFVPENLLMVAGTIPENSMMRIRLQLAEEFRDAARVRTQGIPYENISLVAKTMTDRVKFTWRGVEKTLDSVRLRSFLDVNEPLQINIRGGDLFVTKR